MWNVFFLKGEKKCDKNSRCASFAFRYDEQDIVFIQLARINDIDEQKEWKCVLNEQQQAYAKEH